MKITISGPGTSIERETKVPGALPPKIRAIVGEPFETRRARVQMLAAANKRKNEKNAMRKKLTVLDGGAQDKSTPL
jgi:hypothetical protein